MRRSACWSSVRRYLTDKSPVPTNSSKKWHLTSMCLLLDKLKGFLAKSIAPLLSSHSNTRRPQTGHQKNQHSYHVKRFLHPVGHSYVLSLCSGEGDAFLRPRKPRPKCTPATDSHTRDRTSIVGLVDVVHVYIRLQVVYQLRILWFTVLPERQTQMSRSAQVLDYLPSRTNMYLLRVMRKPCNRPYCVCDIRPRLIRNPLQPPPFRGNSRPPQGPHHSRA